MESRLAVGCVEASADRGQLPARSFPDCRSCTSQELCRQPGQGQGSSFLTSVFTPLSRPHAHLSVKLHLGRLTCRETLPEHHHDVLRPLFNPTGNKPRFLLVCRTGCDTFRSHTRYQKPTRLPFQVRRWSRLRNDQVCFDLQAMLASLQ